MFVFGFIIGLVVGALGLGVAWHFFARAARQNTQQMHDAFTAIASEALDGNSRRLAELAGGTLDAKKELIDQSVSAVNERLEAVRTLLQRVEAERQKHYGELAERLASLSTSTESLRRALAGSRRVGEWGERMTEDVLRLAGLQESVNYIKQSAASAESGKPDFTFLLPNDLIVNMDVKFPLEKSLDFLDAADEPQRRARAAQFIAAVRGHLRAVAGRGYINTAGGTVNYVIVFIPNEQIYSLALELEPTLMDEALEKRIVLCGPLTLYAMLCVIRQAAENANIMKTADEVLALLAGFEKQWQRFREGMEAMGKKLDGASEEYRKLCDTRARMLDRSLEKIDELRASRGLDELPASNQDEAASA